VVRGSGAGIAFGCGFVSRSLRQFYLQHVALLMYWQAVTPNVSLSKAEGFPADDAANVVIRHISADSRGESANSEISGKTNSICLFVGAPTSHRPTGEFSTSEIPDGSLGYRPTFL